MTTTLVKNQTTTHEKPIQYDGRTCTMKVEIRHDVLVDDALLDAAIVLTSLSSQFVYGGHPRYQR